jgi:hypothetical protein
MIQKVAHPVRPDFRVLSNPLKINGERLELQVGSQLGADTEQLCSAPKHVAEA